MSLSHVKTLTLASAAVLSAVVASVTPASAQSTDNVSIGYSHLRFFDDGESVGIPVGWNASFAAGFSESVSLVGDLSGHYLTEAGETLRLHGFQGGLRISGRRSAVVVPFGQVLAGAMHGSIEGDGGFAKVVQFGGGVDVPIGGRGAALRAQVDLPLMFEDGSYVKALRTTVGVVLPLR